MNNYLLKLQKTELTAVKAQINPHFIFNVLNSIQYFISVDENEKAENFITKLSKLIRNTLDYSSKTNILLSDELQYIENYFELENMRFNDQLKLAIIVSEQVNKDKVLFPPMVIQPFLENAIKHAFIEMKNSEKNIIIKFESETKNLMCIIEDNGIGIHHSKRSSFNTKDKKESKGILLAKDKLIIFEKLTKRKTSLDVYDLKEIDNKKSGTQIIIKIENDQNNLN